MMPATRLGPAETPLGGCVASVDRCSRWSARSPQWLGPPADRAPTRRSALAYARSAPASGRAQSRSGDRGRCCRTPETSGGIGLPLSLSLQRCTCRAWEMGIWIVGLARHGDAGALRVRRRRSIARSSPTSSRSAPDRKPRRVDPRSAQRDRRAGPSRFTSSSPCRAWSIFFTVYFSGAWEMSYRGDRREPL